MKKLSLLIVCLTLWSIGYAASFKVVNTITLPFNPTEFKYAHTPDLKFFLCSNKSDMVMFDGTQGKILWQINFLKETGAKKITNQYWNKEANVILIFEEDSKKMISTKYFIDGNTGSVLWKSNEYVSDFGKYELSEGFSNYYDPKLNGVLLPTTDRVDFVNVKNGNIIWSKKFDITGKAKDFDCFIMNYYDLVKVITGKDTQIYLTTTTGEEVSDIDKYYDKKKALKNASRATYLEIPEKNCYVIMKGRESVVLDILGIIGGAGTGAQSWKMNFSAYERGTDKLLWKKDYMIAQSMDWITYEPYVAMSYAEGKLFVEHEPNLKSNSGLTVIDVATGEKIWEAYYSTSSIKGITTTTLTPFPAPSPLVKNGNVFVVDKNKNRLSCFNLNDGSKKWESEKLPDVQKFPGIILTDGILILPYGAAERKIQRSESVNEYCFSYSTPYVRVVCSGSGKNKKQYTYKYIYDDKDIYGVRAYDATTGKQLWSNQTIGKALKDKFSFVASTQLIGDKLYCATNKNLFILNPKNGSLIASSPVSKEKVGDIWGMTYFSKQNQFILNCAKGLVKVDASSGKILGSLKIANIKGLTVSELMFADDAYADYAIFSKGNPKKMDYKEFTSINLDNLSIRGSYDAAVLFYENPRFAEGGDYFYVSDGKKFTLYAVK